MVKKVTRGDRISNSKTGYSTTVSSERGIRQQQADFDVKVHSNITGPAYTHELKLQWTGIWYGTVGLGKEAVYFFGDMGYMSNPINSSDAALVAMLPTDSEAARWYVQNISPTAALNKMNYQGSQLTAEARGSWAVPKTAGKVAIAAPRAMVEGSGKAVYYSWKGDSFRSGVCVPQGAAGTVMTFAPFAKGYWGIPTFRQIGRGNFSTALSPKTHFGHVKLTAGKAEVADVGEGNMVVRHHTSRVNRAQILESKQLNPSRGPNNQPGIHFEMKPFGAAKGGAADTGAAAGGAHVDFIVPKGSILPTCVGPRNTGFIPTAEPFPILPAPKPTSPPNIPPIMPIAPAEEE